MRLIPLIAALCIPVSAYAQVLVQQGDRVQWDQSAASLEEAQNYQYELRIDATKPEETRFVLSNVTCTKTARANDFICQTPLPALSVGQHTLEMAAVKIMSGPSNALLINVQQNDARCAFPTGAGAISIFPTRLLLAGQRAMVSFQLGSANYNVQQVSIMLREADDIASEAVATISGTNVTDVGSLWFNQPTDPGDYTISIRAVNALGCTRTVTTSYRLPIQ